MSNESESFVFPKKKNYRITWHGYDKIDISSAPRKGSDTFVGDGWCDAVNQFLDARFRSGPRYFFIDFTEEWEHEQADN